jgi:hypothetical protein
MQNIKFEETIDGGEVLFDDSLCEQSNDTDFNKSTSQPVTFGGNVYQLLLRSFREQEKHRTAEKCQSYINKKSTNRMTSNGRATISLADEGGRISKVTL